jgi:hypothetical protein
MEDDLSELNQDKVKKKRRAELSLNRRIGGIVIRMRF